MIKVFMCCSGIGSVKRGFETFTRECFDALVDEPSIQLTLFKGAGESNCKEITLWNLSRSKWAAIQLSKLTRRGCYNIEQSTFFASLLPHIYRENPDIIYFSDINFGHALWHWRRLTKKRYILLFSNGCPQDPPFPRWDHIHQVTPFQFQKALDAKEPHAKQSLIPYGFHIPSQLPILTSLEKKSLRSKLKLPEDRIIIISVGWIDKSHKRMDYLIREVARLPEPRPYLLLLGHQDLESSKIINLGIQLLGFDNFHVRTAEPTEICNYYKTADIFTLASLKEGFGRVFVEAMAHGLPCLAHDYEITQFVLGNEGYLSNFELPGNLANLIAKVLSEPIHQSKPYLRYQSVYERFSWDILRPKYIDMIHKCATNY